MVRPVRIDLEGHWYHVVARGQRGEILFDGFDDYVRYLSELQSALKKCHCKLGAFCLIPNHVHLLVYRGSQSLARVMQLTHSRYGRYFNRRHSKKGYVFQGRYKAFLVLDDRYLATLLRYIHRNPEEAGLVRRASEYCWSSDRVYRSGEPIEWISVTRVPGFEGVAGSRKYGDLMKDTDKCELPRYETFIGESGMEKDLERRSVGRSAGKWRERRGVSTILSRAKALVRKAGQTLSRLKKGGQTWRFSRIRQRVMVELYDEGYPPSAIARTFDVTPSAVIRAKERV